MIHHYAASYLPYLSHSSLTIFTLLILASYIAAILFCWTLFKAMRQVPENKRVFPAWFVWMILIPVVGYVFQWLMIPFGIPKSFDKTCHDNPMAVHDTKVLFGIGLAKMICLLLVFVPFLGAAFGLAGFVLWIIYWTKVATFRRVYLS